MKIEEDLFGPYAKIMTKYFLAEGAVQKNHLLSASLNENPWDLVIKSYSKSKLKYYQNIKFDLPAQQPAIPGNRAY